MTLQQLEYIVVLNKYRHFVRAANACNVTQPTLSAMVQKLEDELDIKIFDRTKNPIEPTDVGEEVIAQAQIVLQNISQVNELVKSSKHGVAGKLNLAVIPTIAPYLLPKFIMDFRAKFNDVSLQVSEMRTSTIIEQLKLGTIDMGILATPLNDKDLFEIPLYYEKFIAYIAPSENKIYALKTLSADDMPLKSLWVLQEGHCLTNQIFNFCKEKGRSSQVYEAGSIDTLVKIVDKNGGYTVIPELHYDFLSEEQKKNIRTIENPPAVREISIVIKKEFIKEGLLNAVAEIVKSIIPNEMLDERLKKFAIRL